MMVGDSKFGGSADNLVAEIDKKRNLPLSIFLGSLGIDGLGRREVEIACSKAPEELCTLADWRSGKLRNQELADRINAPSKAERWAKGIDDMASVIDGLLANGCECQPFFFSASAAATPSTGPLSGSSFCFTGAIQRVEAGKRLTRDEMWKLTRDNGGTVDEDVRATTTYLVQADPTSQSSKSKKAAKYGTKMLAESDFFKMIGM